MLIAYDSRTGNVRRFIEKLELPAIQIDETMKLEEPFILVTYTTGFGQIPDKVNSFLQKNGQQLKGVCASGNRNWGLSFAKSADTISQTYGVPILCKFELSGTNKDILHLKEELNTLAAY
ncbi:class Ib ribonucleoside-diphosphate reductase assembly flavoprotein NrdI [Saccharibacillus sp. JS10]|uniref:class Ib ribonucleoside-diphosphate reductase assembly flavoprotein NrdI n=1 Tax=Saccharibacillus sp. JS10 TaxID=2950552 RepID=UPI002109781C|nr:class Ib ribonucleoside-diphosphate reductase assembly flavoprotein NrdI [Saccharibacillus sp. JS10]MCQ4086600.1 class Ib ribonucleoside-diphosphate reductase assembly flavoprotein NrdI [Saccharibacillus sp. JS10]